MTATLRTGQLAEAAEVNVQTLRYYERRGLLPEPLRSPGGHRVYGPDAATVLRVIRGLQSSPFPRREAQTYRCKGACRQQLALQGPKGLSDSAPFIGVVQLLAQVHPQALDVRGINQVKPGFDGVKHVGAGV